MSFQEQRSRGLAVGWAIFFIVIAGVSLSGWTRRIGSGRPLLERVWPPALDEPIRPDSALRAGALDNGLRYYVRENGALGERVELRLVVDVGSVLEEEDERGMAHAVEHLALSGTRSFRGNAIDRYMESIGMRRGDGSNASTSFGETVYRMTVPPDRPGVLDSALAMLAEVAHDATFDPEDVRGEGDILLEEWRTRRDADQRLYDARNAILFGDSPYARRAVIGDTAVLRRFDLRAMRRFYEKWYRPDRMAIVAVGGLSADETQDLVKRHFGRIPRSTGHLPRHAPVVARSAEPRAAVLTDVEATGTQVGIWHPRPPVRYHLRSDYRKALVADLWSAILGARLEDAAGEPGAPIVNADVSSQRLARTLSAQIVSALAVKDRALPAVELLASEANRLARTGATPREVEDRAAVLLGRARRSAEAGEASTTLANEYVDHFLTGNAPVTDRAAFELARDLLPTITADDVTAYGRRLAADSGAVVLVTTPTDDAAARIQPGELIARARAGAARVAGTRAEPADDRRLIDREPAAGRIASEREIEEAGAREWTLSNGMRVLLKPTEFADDEIQFRAVAPGGASLASDEDYPSAYLADVILERTGVGPLSGTRLSRSLEPTSISLSAAVTDDAISLTGTTASSDLTRFFQLVHLYLTAPRNDTVAFRQYREGMAAVARNRAHDPDAIFADSVDAIISRHHPRGLKRGAAFYAAAALPKALAFWRARTSNASGFTVVVTGDFTPREIRPLVTRYLASLPAGAPERPRDMGLWRDTGVVRRTIVAGIGGRARTRLVLSGPMPVTSEATKELWLVREVLDRALDERLRESLGGTYGVGVVAEVDLVPPASYAIAIDFDGSPQRIEALAAATLEELERLRTAGPTEAEFAAARLARVRDYDGKLTSNDYWSSELSWHARLGWPLAPIADHRDQTERLTLAELKRACATLIPAGRYTRVTMRPRA